jgi:hypothetical protein
MTTNIHLLLINWKLKLLFNYEKESNHKSGSEKIRAEIPAYSIEKKRLFMLCLVAFFKTTVCSRLVFAKQLRRVSAFQYRRGCKLYQLRRMQRKVQRVKKSAQPEIHVS